eukprot:scaffold104897_cov72-Phaeocystis_antarctica.AAC.9
MRSPTSSRKRSSKLSLGEGRCPSAAARNTSTASRTGTLAPTPLTRRTGLEPLPSTAAATSLGDVTAATPRWYLVGVRRRARVRVEIWVKVVGWGDAAAVPADDAARRLQRRRDTAVQRTHRLGTAGRAACRFACLVVGQARAACPGGPGPWPQIVAPCDSGGHSGAHSAPTAARSGSSASKTAAATAASVAARRSASGRGSASRRPSSPAASASASVSAAEMEA